MSMVIEQGQETYRHNNCWLFPLIIRPDALRLAVFCNAIGECNKIEISKIPMIFKTTLF